MKQRDWKNRLTDAMDLTGDVSLEPLVELSGDRRVLIERHRGILQYQRDRICVKVKFGTVAVTGEDLEIYQMSQEKLVISGCVDAVILLRRDS